MHHYSNDWEEGHHGDIVADTRYGPGPHHDYWAQAHHEYAWHDDEHGVPAPAAWEDHHIGGYQYHDDEHVGPFDYAGDFGHHDDYHHNSPVDANDISVTKFLNTAEDGISVTKFLDDEPLEFENGTDLLEEEEESSFNGL